MASSKIKEFTSVLSEKEVYYKLIYSSGPIVVKPYTHSKSTRLLIHFKITFLKTEKMLTPDYYFKLRLEWMPFYFLNTSLPVNEIETFKNALIFIEITNRDLFPNSLEAG
jgi:hypothetical protein